MNDEEKTTNEEPKANTTPTVTDYLLEAFMAYYEPATPGDPEAEPKTTNDIIDEMESIEEVQKGIVASYLANNGFKITYTEAGPFWYVKLKAAL